MGACESSENHTAETSTKPNQVSLPKIAIVTVTTTEWQRWMTPEDLFFWVGECHMTASVFWGEADALHPLVYIVLSP